MSGLVTTRKMFPGLKATRAAAPRRTLGHRRASLGSRFAAVGVGCLFVACGSESSPVGMLGQHAEPSASSGKQTASNSAFASNTARAPTSSSALGSTSSSEPGATPPLGSSSSGAGVIPSSVVAPSASMSPQFPGVPNDKAPLPRCVSQESVKLLAIPMVFAPTESGFSVSALVAAGDARRLLARVAAADDPEAKYTELGAPLSPVCDVAEWRVGELTANTKYSFDVYEIGADGMERTLSTTVATTARAKGESFTFALISDTHIGADLSYSNQGTPEVLRLVASQIAKAQPDFVINLGDVLDFHQYGFNDPPPSGEVTSQAYRNYRALISETSAGAAHFGVVGNWDGESGHYTAQEIAWSRAARKLYMPNPTPSTYPEGGGVEQDYYAFTWGDALFVVLNVMTYTPTAHLLSSSAAGLPDDWTLGQAQFDWLQATLKDSKAKWKFTFIHHTVGGKAADDINSAYGRGGGQAAYIGEQALVHQMLREYGVQIFFYGHDHVFADMVVDGVHYTMPSCAGAPWPFDKSITGYEQSWLTPGWGHVEVSPERVHVQFRGTDESTPHEYSLTQ
jgi:3',5'-cyclic AMP phosphodiesterase CpdA